MVRECNAGEFNRLKICTVNRVTIFPSTGATRRIEKADPRSHTLIRLASLLECAAATEGAADAE